MKKLIGIVAALAVFFAQQACSEGDDPAPGIRLSTETLDFPAGKSTLDLVVSSPQQWRLRVSAEWCYVLGADVLNEPCEGKTFRVGVDGNNALKGREALITLTGADGTVKTVTVTQGAAEELSPAIRSFRFRAAANAAKLPQDVTLEVGDGIISGRTSFVVEDKVLVPEFEFEGDGVYLGAQEIVSGETEVDFSGPVVLTVRSKGGEEREYRVSLVCFTGLPVVYIDTGGIPVVSKEEYVAASLKVVDNNGLRPSGVFRGDVNIKGRGNSTWGMPKKPYRLKFDKKQSLLGEPKDKSWVLLANYMDNACGIRNATAYAIGHLSCLEFTPTTHFVDVFLNDRYNGTYQLCEHMKISEDRVNVTDEGYLLEADQLDRLGPDDVYFRTERILMNIKDPDVEPGSPLRVDQELRRRSGECPLRCGFRRSRNGVCQVPERRYVCGLVRDQRDHQDQRRVALYELLYEYRTRREAEHGADLGFRHLHGQYEVERYGRARARRVLEPRIAVVRADAAGSGLRAESQGTHRLFQVQPRRHPGADGRRGRLCRGFGRRG